MSIAAELAALYRRDLTRLVQELDAFPNDETLWQTLPVRSGWPTHRAASAMSYTSRAALSLFLRSSSQPSLRRLPEAACRLLIVNCLHSPLCEPLQQVGHNHRQDFAAGAGDNADGLEHSFRVRSRAILLHWFAPCVQKKLLIAFGARQSARKHAAILQTDVFCSLANACDGFIVESRLAHDPPGTDLPAIQFELRLHQDQIFCTRFRGRYDRG